jgi:2-polyprenyl-3-methyl-5-hydroxy-6-metoxy-1,4-benzoquinol methylase
MAAHWANIYTTRPPDEVSWYEAVPTVSLRRINEAIKEGARSVIDVGGGASRLADQLVDRGLTRLAVLDISGQGLEVARMRLGDQAHQVEWIEADVTKVQDLGRFDVWHDRAVFHFLTEPADRVHYVALCEQTVTPGGIAIVATFAPDGPQTCSGLPVRRYDASRLTEECGPSFGLIDSERFVHTTPRGAFQPFVYSSFRRLVENPVLVPARQPSP